MSAFSEKPQATLFVPFGFVKQAVDLLGHLARLMPRHGDVDCGPAAVRGEAHVVAVNRRLAVVEKDAQVPETVDHSLLPRVIRNGSQVPASTQVKNVSRNGIGFSMAAHMRTPARGFKG